MLKVNQAKDFCVNLFGQPVPKYALYGCIDGVNYIYNHTSLGLSVYTGKFWTKVDLKNYSKIHTECIKFMCEGADVVPKAVITTGKGHFAPKTKSTKHIDFVNKPCEYCEFRKVSREEEKTRQARQEEKARREKARRELEKAREIHSCGPQMKRAQSTFDFRGRGVNPSGTYVDIHDENGNVVSTAWSYDYETAPVSPFEKREEKKFGKYQGLDVVYGDTRATSDYLNKQFEVGQTTAGPVAYIPKRNGIALDKGAQRNEARANARAKRCESTVKVTSRTVPKTVLEYNKEAHEINKMCGRHIVDLEV